MAITALAGRKTHQAVGLYLGAGLAALMLVVAPPEGLTVAGWRTAALGVCMGIWWATEALPVAATALLPGPMTRPEKRVAGVFLLLAFAWIGRPFLTSLPGLEGLSDAGLAILAALALFLIPSGSDEARSLMHWGDTSDLPWGVLLLFGGGLTLAAAVSSTGLAAWLGTRLTDTRLTGSVLLIVALAGLVIFLTELTSNLATTATFLPVVAAVAVQSGWAPIALTAPVALAASCAFMLPVATPPNAIVYGSGMLTIPEMVRAGFWLNLIGIVLVSLVGIFLAPMILS